MEQQVHLQRQHTNVDFLDGNAQTFAGLYVLKGSTLSVAEALNMLKASFEFTFSASSADVNGEEWSWGIYPFQEELSDEAFSIHKPIAPGRYLVVRRLERRDNAGGEHVFDQCCTRVEQAIAKPPPRYRPMTDAPILFAHNVQGGNQQKSTESRDEVSELLEAVRDAREAQQRFHSLSNLFGHRCAISGRGRHSAGNSQITWYDPSLKMGHIIPPQHFDVFPVPRLDMEKGDDEVARKWAMTWNPQENGIVLLDHFHALWKARLVAIEPSTLEIRCFGPYDSIARYEGKKATFCGVPNKEALRWHYDVCVYENITAKQPHPPPTAKHDEGTEAAVPTWLSDPATRIQPVPIIPIVTQHLYSSRKRDGKEALPGERPHKTQRAGQDSAALPQLAEGGDSGDQAARQLCSLQCILCLGDATKSDPSCPNFSRHQRLGSGQDTVHKLDTAALSEWGLLRSEDWPESHSCPKNIISEYEIVSRESVPIFRVVLPFGYTVIGKGIVLSDDSTPTITEAVKGPSLAPLVEAGLFMTLSSQLAGRSVAGECVPFCLGLIKFGKELREPGYDGRIAAALLLASADVPLSSPMVPQDRVTNEILRTMKDLSDRGVTVRERLADTDLRWNQQAQRVMVVNLSKLAFDIEPSPLLLLNMEKK